MSGPFAFVTLISSDSYLPGALVLAASLRDLHPSPPVPPEVDFKTVCIVTPETVNVQSIKALRKAFDLVVGTEVFEAENSAGLRLLGRPDLTTAMTKLHVFRLTEFAKIIYLDADILPLKPMSHLFLTSHEFSACPDVGWPDIFNSGMMVLTPGEDKFQELVELFKSKGSWDGADQGLLNEWRGSNWNRLSFAYNTTPTSAYTYAPAFERFGATIKAIHFIGPNKPWASIPWRAPIEHPSAESMQSYGYSNLVDRWFAVYDKHYRPPVRATEEEYRLQHYVPAWETPTAEGPGPDQSPAFDLERLRRMAIEGVSTSHAVAEGEGEYRSMPLEGRVDLMRPRRASEEHHEGSTTEPSGHDVSFPIAEGPQPSHTAPEHEYRPPGREGLPAHLYRSPSRDQGHPISEHPSPTSQQTYDQGSKGEILQQEQRQEEQQEDQKHKGDDIEERRPASPPMIHWNPALEPPPTNPPPIAGMAFSEQQYTNIWDLPPSRPIVYHHPHQEYRDPWTRQSSYSPTYQQQQEGRYQQPHQYHQQFHGHRPYHEQQQQRQQQQHRHRHHRQSSHHHDQGHKGYQAPGYGGHQASHSHSHAHREPAYPGILQFHHQHYQPYPETYHGQAPHQPPHHAPRPEDFFHEPAPSKIPANLVREGHYTAVTSEKPKPDSSKVDAVFPWEQRSRPAPRRVFPDWDPKRSAAESPLTSTVAEVEASLIREELVADGLTPPVPAVPERIPSPPPPPHVKRKFNPPPTPPMRQGGAYVNAWDTDRGIQRYASSLQGRSSPFSPQPWPTHTGQEAFAAKSKRSPSAEEDEDEEYTNWVERAEASSRDGDDEDDEEGSPLLSPRSAARRRAAKEKGNRYRHQGVQTDPKMYTESRGVQVNILVEAGKRLSGNYDVTPTGRPQPIKSSSPSKSQFEPQQTRVSVGTAPVTAPSSTTVESQAAKDSVGNGTVKGPTLRKRESSEDSVTTAAESSVISSPTKDMEEPGTPKVQISMPEPAEPTPVAGRGSGIMRRVGRVFSPSTGVDIFKRGSEEVLARFLMQSPSGWGAARHANGAPEAPGAPAIQ